jgi:hypothetical protein
MHNLIGLIVYAETRNEALATAKETLERLCGEDGQPFDYGSTMDDLYARWQIKPVVMRADGKRGKVFLNRMMKATERNFRDALSKLREHLERPDDELWTDRYGEQSKDCVDMRHRAWQVGQYTGSQVHLYTWERAGIRCPDDLKSVLDKYSSNYNGKSNPYANLNVYVVPADVHY